MKRFVKNYDVGYNLSKPKRFSRKNNICSCLCPIIVGDKVLDRVMIEYKITPNKSLSYIPIRKGTWSTYQNYGEFENFVELPEVFTKLVINEDFEVRTGFFERDNIQMPFVYSITILNTSKYNLSKKRIERRKKLTNILIS